LANKGFHLFKFSSNSYPHIIFQHSYVASSTLQAKNIKQISFLYLWKFQLHMGSQPFKFLLVILNQNSFNIHVLEHIIQLTQTKSNFLTTWPNPLGASFMDSFFFFFNFLHNFFFEANLIYVCCTTFKHKFYTKSSLLITKFLIHHQKVIRLKEGIYPLKLFLYLFYVQVT
jgi:hypothetical protein